MIRQSLIEHWQQKLALGEMLLSHSSPRQRWLGQIYVRLYRFLLNTYGGEALPTNESHETAEDEKSSPTPFCIPPITRDELSGAPAKSIETMRHTLENIQTVNPKVEAGTAHLLNREWIMVAEKTPKISLIACRRLLQQFQIRSQISQRGERYIIEVLFTDRDQARKLLASHPDEIRFKVKRKKRLHITTTFQPWSRSDIFVLVYVTVVITCFSFYWFLGGRF